MLIFTLVAVALGSLVGILLNPQMGIYKSGLSMRQKKWLRLPGDMFLRLLKMLILPLIVSSNVSSIASLNSRGARWLAGISILYIILTSVISVIVGIFLVLIIQPGYYRAPMSEQTQAPSVKGTLKLLDSVMDMILNFIPENVIKATLQKDSAFESSKSSQTKSSNDTNGTVIQVDEQPDLKGTNILGLIMFSILFGLAVRSLGSDIAVLL